MSTGALTGGPRMTEPSRDATFRAGSRPEVALVTNHGYAGATIPAGGAPDTGGQNLYVNALAKALERIGYRVTIFSRGGFPYFGSTRIRSEPEYLSDHVRYVFLPGGGEEFIPKEEIAVALDEELEALDAFVRREAEALGRPPWEVYELVNTHYWDGAVLGARLVERWRNDVAAAALARLLEGVIAAGELERLTRDRHRKALGKAPAYQLGHILLHRGERSHTASIESRVRAAASRWAEANGGGESEVERLVGAVDRALLEARETFSVPLHDMVAAEALGEAAMPPAAAERLRADLDRTDRHVWTPQSLGELKDENFRNRVAAVRRGLRFCERRSHERMVCHRTRAFTAISVEIAQWLRTHYRVPTERLFYFPPCIDSRRFRRYAEPELAPAYRYLAAVSGVEEQRLRTAKIVVETSRMDNSKRKDLLLEAFRMVLRGREDVHLFVGGGPVNDISRALRRQLRASAELVGRVHLTGFIPDEHIGPLFSLADVYASASEMEGFGMSVSQAAASATAVVSTDLTPFCVQYAPDAALIVPAGDTQQFAAAIGRLLDDAAEREDRGRRLAESVRVLDWEAQTQALLDHLRRRGIAIAPPGSTSGS